MGWTKLKAILVAVLLGANALLGFQIFSLYRSTEYLPEESLNAVCEMLAQSGISVPASVLNGKKSDLLIYEGVLGEDYYTSAAKSLSRSDTQRFFNTPTGYVMTMENGDRFVFYDGFGLHYERSGAPEYRALDAWNDGTLETLSAREERALSRTLASFLGAADRLTDAQSLSLSYRILYSGRDPESGLTYCVAAQYAHDAQVLGFSSSFVVRDGTVVGMLGEWSFACMDQSYSAQLMDQINILYNVRNRVLEARTDDGSSVTGISDLSMSYAAYFRGDSGKFYLIPVWHTEMEDGTVYDINAVDGTVYTN